MRQQHLLTLAYLTFAAVLTPTVSSAQSYGTSAGAAIWIYIDGPQSEIKPLTDAFATEASKQVTFQGTNSRATALADLRAGVANAFVTSTYACCMQGSASATIVDRLNFTIAGASHNTVTYVPVEFEVKGTLSATEGQGAIAQGSLSLTQYSTIGSNEVPIDLRGFGASYYMEDGGYKQFGSNNSWASFDFSENNQSFVARGNIALYGAATTVDFSLILSTIITGSGTSDYSTGPNGSRVRFYLPSEVSYVSASGTNPVSVPEPATWALMIGGFGAVGAASRRRRKLAVA